MKMPTEEVIESFKVKKFTSKKRNTRKKRGGGRPEREKEIQLFKLATGNGTGNVRKKTLSLFGEGVNVNARHDEDEMYEIMEEENKDDSEEEEWIKPSFTALHYACYYNQIDMVKLLIGRDANIHVIDQYGNTPLHIACEQGRIDIIKTLLDNGANINFGTELSEGAEHYETPLHTAIESEDNISKKMKIVTTLVDRGANINALTSIGFTPLHSAVYMAAMDEVLNSIVLYLIEKGANVNIGDEEGNTPLHYAVNKKNDIAITLIDKGADYDAKNNDGKTAINGDSEYKGKAMARFLEWRKGIINHIRNLPKSQERRMTLSLGNRDPNSPLSTLPEDNITEINKFVIGGKLKNKKTRKKRNKK